MQLEYLIQQITFNFMIQHNTKKVSFIFLILFGLFKLISFNRYSNILQLAVLDLII